VIETVEGHLALQPYTGKIPPDDFPDDQNSDPGLSDLLADDYLHYRLDAQLKYYSQKLARLHTTRTCLQIGIFALGGLSTFLASFGASLTIWVAFTTSLAAALMIWMEVSRLDSLVNNYNQLILELNIIRDHWQSLSQEERTDDEFFKLVIATEKVLWSQHNQHITQMRRAVTDLQSSSNDLLTQVMNKPAPSTIHQALLSNNQKHTTVEILSVEAKIIPKETAIKEVTKKVKEETGKTNKKGLPHAFIVMPFGRKKDPDGR
jgi:hypothetical protein